MTSKACLYLSIAIISLIVLGGQAAYAQTTTLRNPLIPGAYTQPAGTPVTSIQGPPIGSGDIPVGIPQGDLGDPIAPPSMVELPPASPMDKATINSELSGYLTPPPSAQGADPGPLPGPIDFQPPPAAIVNINANGGLPNNGAAPIVRWPAQTTTDWGLGQTQRTYRQIGSQTTDFGQKLSQMQNLGAQPQDSQDGPIPVTYPGQMGTQPIRQPNLPNAQETQSLYGNRVKFSQYQPIETLAPY